MSKPGGTRGPLWGLRHRGWGVLGIVREGRNGGWWPETECVACRGVRPARLEGCSPWTSFCGHARLGEQRVPPRPVTRPALHTGARGDEMLWLRGRPRRLAVR